MAKRIVDVDKIKEIVRRLDCAKDLLFRGGVSIPPKSRMSKDDYWGLLDAAEDQVIAAAALLGEEIAAVCGKVRGKGAAAAWEKFRGKDPAWEKFRGKDPVWEKFRGKDPKSICH